MGKRSGRPPGGEMPLIEHLLELRTRLGWSVLALFVAVVAAFIVWEPVFEFLQQPYARTPQGRADPALYSFGPFEQFAVRLRVSFIAGTLASSPIWLYQLGAFITPALHPKEKRYAGGFLAASLLLFAGGCVMAYLTLDKGLEFLFDIGGEDITSLPNVREYLNFVTLTLLAFGIAFLFPVVIVFLNLIGVLPAERMRRWRRGMVVGIFAGAALITPSQDPFTFIIMAVPLYGLYEAVIVVARVRERRARRRAAADPENPLDDDTPSQIDTTPSSL